jgi:isocitrate/isopropylmalate dehydrogenase
MGLMPSASVGEHFIVMNLFGSYPQATGLNIAKLATVLSAAMMFEDALIKRRSRGY